LEAEQARSTAELVIFVLDRIAVPVSFADLVSAIFSSEAIEPETIELVAIETPDVLSISTLTEPARLRLEEYSAKITGERLGTMSLSSAPVIEPFRDRGANPDAGSPLVWVIIYLTDQTASWISIT